ncbi:hypothetical protein Golob_001436 [Gossypium lobatum]|uniref:Uncharacterized protein n=1 Tax=Gossypium lobatum TaxID=34289 RepID=A0A7J8NB07_9ROSI|nr:hypothetical protein [Gossypium lobatum]
MMLMIHFQNLLVDLNLDLVNHKGVAGFVHSPSLHTSHTLMLTLLTSLIDLRSHSFHLEEHLQRKRLPTLIYMDHSGYAPLLYL